MTLAIAPLRADLSALVDPSPVIVDPAACTAYAVDGKIPDCVVAPAKAEQVAAVLRYAAEHQMAVIARGDGTKLATGNAPRRYDVALSLRELHSVVHFEPADLTITVQAGMTFGEFQDLAARHGLWLPLDPRGGREATMGGIIAANAAGPLRQGYGGPRDMVLGLRIATTQGTVVKTGGRVVKNVAGYDLGKLITGSFGTLGVIVEASLKLFPKPPERATFAMRAGTLGMARDLRRRILHSPLDPLRVVLIDSTAAALLAKSPMDQGRPETDVRVELGGSHRVIERCMHELRQLSAAGGAQLTRVDAAEDSWTKVSDLAHWLQSNYPALTILKAALPLTASEEIISRAQQEAEAEQIKLASFAQVGVGIVHLCFLQQALTAAVAGLVNRLRQAAGDLRGSLVIEQCPVELKKQLDVWGAAGDDFSAMQKLKSLWDPKDVLSPGRFVGGI
jgi:glycolate oxidase FAD binding subunit